MWGCEGVLWLWELGDPEHWFLTFIPPKVMLHKPGRLKKQTNMQSWNPGVPWIQWQQTFAEQ